jgi:tetratricopeptide (TPR) repeat protein
MKMLNRLLSGGRARSAARRLAQDPSARHYTELVQEYAVQEELEEALKVATEGLRVYPGDAELKRLYDRTRSIQREGRTRELANELASAPRPALWRELIEILIESGRLDRAEEAAAQWCQSMKSGEAQLYRAQVRAERFFTDRRRDDGRSAFDLATEAVEATPGDPRALRLQLQIASRCGAWGEARRSLAHLLELTPGDPALEARFRTVMSLAESAKTLDQALREVEKTGRLADDEPDTERPGAAGNVRPMLQTLAKEPGVRAAFYMRGGTALVQGPKGATADRAARGVREVVVCCRTAARRLGLGQATEVRLEGDFGTLLVSPGELGSGALWCEGDQVTRRHEQGLRDLAGIAGQATGRST